MSHHCACRGAGRSQAVGRVAWFLASSCVQAPTCNVSVFQSASLRHNLGPTSSSSRPLTRRLNKGVSPAIACRFLAGFLRSEQCASVAVRWRVHRHQRRNRSSPILVPRGAGRPLASPSVSASRSRFASSCMFAALVVHRQLVALRGSRLLPRSSAYLQRIGLSICTASA